MESDSVGSNIIWPIPTIETWTTPTNFRLPTSSELRAVTTGVRLSSRSRWWRSPSILPIIVISNIFFSFILIQLTSGSNRERGREEEQFSLPHLPLSLSFERWDYPDIVLLAEKRIYLRHNKTTCSEQLGILIFDFEHKDTCRYFGITYVNMSI